MLHDTRARHFDAAAEKVAMEWSQELLVKATENVNASPASFKGVKAADVLPAASAPAYIEMEEEDATSFLAKMNRI